MVVHVKNKNRQSEESERVSDRARRRTSLFGNSSHTPKKEKVFDSLLLEQVFLSFLKGTNNVMNVKK